MDIIEAVENARIASSASNQQVLRYTIVKSPEMVAAMQPLVAWAAKLPREKGTPHDGQKPTAFIAISYEGDETACAVCDLGIAAQTSAVTCCAAGVLFRTKALRIASCAFSSGASRVTFRNSSLSPRFTARIRCAAMLLTGSRKS